MNIKKFYLSLFFVLILGLILSVNLKSSDILGNVTFTGGPKIVFAEKQRDFGKILQGDIIQYEFDFTNEGDSELEITNVQTSCGCTAATAGEKNKYAAGEKGKIKITFNSNGKVGKVEKTVLIQSNSLAPNDQIILTLNFDVKLPSEEEKQHMTIMAGQSIFDGACKDCHVTKGIGKIGKELYDADCGICHGDPKDHKPHGPIDKNSASKYTDDQLVNYIKAGSPNQPTMMPGFHKDNGGPLTTDEIMTLLAYIRSDLSVNSFIKE
jgi:mono/diheme cytochrome c family protein